MTKKVETIYKQALTLVIDKKCLFIEHLIAYLPISKATFYDYFKVGSNELNELKELISNNRINRKIQMYNKWFDSDNATLQVSLMKLLGNEEERNVLNNSRLAPEPQPEKEIPNIVFYQTNDNGDVNLLTDADKYDKNKPNVYLEHGKPLPKD
jgi:hypothetical protein